MEENTPTDRNQIDKEESLASFSSKYCRIVIGTDVGKKMAYKWKKQRRRLSWITNSVSDDFIQINWITNSISDEFIQINFYSAFFHLLCRNFLI